MDSLGSPAAPEIGVVPPSSEQYPISIEVTVPSSASDSRQEETNLENSDTSRTSPTSVSPSSSDPSSTGTSTS